MKKFFSVAGLVFFGAVASYGLYGLFWLAFLFFSCSVGMAVLCCLAVELLAAFLLDFFYRWCVKQGMGNRMLVLCTYLPTICVTGVGLFISEEMFFYCIGFFAAAVTMLIASAVMRCYALSKE